MAVSNPALAESGVIIPHANIVGNGELTRGLHGWGNPVAKIVIKRVRAEGTLVTAVAVRGALRAVSCALTCERR